VRRHPLSKEEAIALGRLTLAKDRAKAAPLIDSLLNHRRPFRAHEFRLLEGAPLVDLLSRISYSFRHDDPAKMILFAQAACSRAQQISNRRYGTEVSEDLRATAWIELANAYRVADRIEDVGPALGRARNLLLSGTQSESLLARFMEIYGLYLTEMRQFEEAISAFESAAELFEELGQKQDCLRVQLDLAHALSQSYDADRALLVYCRVLTQLEAGSTFTLAATHGLIFNLIEAGHGPLAMRLLTRSRRLYRRSGRLNKIRLVWLEGKLAKALNQYGHAEAKFNQALLAFRHLGKEYDAAQVSLELAWVYVRQGRHRETVWLVESLIGTFRRLGIAREVLASLALLKRSCEERRPVEGVCGQIEVLTRLLPEIRPRSAK